MSSLRPYKPLLEALYARYHQPLYRSLDPVEIVWGYIHPEDQAIAGLWAALFAWGRRSVAIQKTHALLQSLAPSPYAYLQTGQVLRISLRHRTWKPETITRLWEKLRELYGRCGSLAGFFRPYRESLWEGVAAFQAEMTKGAPELRRHLGDLRAGSASKRLWLWLRWMIRKDAIDPGPWADAFSAAQLHIPLDVHLLAWARQTGIIGDSTPSWRAAVQLTEAFREITPNDPLRYDFALLTASALGEIQKVTSPS